MNVHQIWNLDLLKEEVAKAWLRLRNLEESVFSGTMGQRTYTLDILARSGTQQHFEIAEALGVDLDEYFMTEAEWDAFRERFHHLRKELTAELQRCLDLPEGTLLSLDYDEEGNFGLILRIESAEDKNSSSH